MTTWRQRLIDWLARATRPEAPPTPPPVGTYCRYTTEFDETVSADELSARFDEIVEPLPSQHPTESEDLDVDQFRTTLRNSCAELSQHLAELSSSQRKDIVLSLLVDQSGSQQAGQPTCVALVSEALANTLTKYGVAIEVLGFTTSRWRGGKSRIKWIHDGAPRYPGRLNDLLHIIYLDATVEPGPGPHLFPLMQNPLLFKENIDGEALEWAAKRLTDHPAPVKILIVVSDGAPVDDSTLHSNWPTILSDHLAATVKKITQEGKIALGGMFV